ncbi:hypothetical protein [Haliea sp. E17]|uniref:hypothetical protein n=1 Tax=Haliea sp. E17 TaxID=3401576 RepID=UPI003AB0DF02
MTLTRPKLYLHIGRPKTGSTALQRFLADNAPHLQQAGLLYPLAGRFQQASHLFAYACLPQMCTAAGLPRPDAALLWQQLERERESSGASAVVLSSENFWFASPADLPEDLEQRYDVQVIAYVRRQDNVIASSFCEEAKAGIVALDSDVELYALDGVRLGLLDYLQVLDAWAARFGDERIHVRVYEQVQARGIQADICELLGLAPDSLVFAPQPANPSLPYDALRLAAHADQFALGNMPRRAFLHGLSEAVEHLPYDADYDAGGLFSGSLRERILTRFGASNAEVARRFRQSPRGELFPGLVGEHHVHPEDALEPERIAKLMIGLLISQERKCHRLAQRVSRLEKQLEKLLSAVEKPGD